MKGYFLFVKLVCLVSLAGCASNRDLIATASLATRNDVFTEIASSEAPAGKAIVDISFSVKRNSSRFMWITNKHSDPSYRMHLNICGQTTILDAEPVLEVKEPVDSNVSESGTGWKYHFSKRIALTPGKHKLTIVLPIDDVIVEREIDLSAGVNTITVTPVYSRRNLRPFKGENFTAGVKSLDLIVK